MKTPSTDLHDLILSMSRYEKRHFKLISRTFRRDGGTLYLQLFEAMSKQKTYDEVALKLEFAERLNDNRFSVAKTYLYRHLLKVLHLIQKPENLPQKIRMALEYVQVLYRRELYAQAEKQLKKAEKMLEVVGDPLLCFEVLEWRFRLHKVNHFLKLPENEFASFASRLEENREKASGYMELFAKYAEFRYFRSRDGYLRNSRSFQERSRVILQSDAFRNPPKEKAFAARIMYFHAWGIHHYVRGDYEQSYSVYSELSRLLQQFPQFFQDQDHIYSGVLFDYGVVALQLRDWGTLRGIIVQLEEMQRKGERQMARRFFYLTLLKARTFLDSISMEYANLDIGQTALQSEGYRNKLSQFERFALFFHLALLAFFRNEFSLALQLLSQILNDKELRTVPEAYLFTRLIRLVIHLELKNYDLIEAFGQNVYRYITGRDSKFKMEGLVARAFGKLLHLRSQGERKRFLQEFRIQLRNLLQDPTEGRFAQYFDYDGWIESRLEGKELVEVVREKVMGG